jgi:DNA-binding CsgD family transcriptional regulator
MHQLKLLADTPRARRSDPETSHQAAAAIKATGALTKQQHQVLDAVRQWPGKTAVELARLAGIDRYAVSRRLPELSGVHVRRGPPRACTVNGRAQTVWYPVNR